MKAVLLIITSLLLAGCRDEPEAEKNTSEGPASPGYPVIYVDLAHYQVEQEDGTKPFPYFINETGGLILDFSKCEPALAQEFEEMNCNSIQFAIGGGQKYQADFDPSLGRQILDKESLLPHPGSPPFTKIKPGDLCVLAIGRMTQEVGKPSSFLVAWVSMVESQPEYPPN